jgi:hypothetical protein
MKTLFFACLLLVVALSACLPSASHEATPIHYGGFPITKVADKPPLGWNSWDVFGADVTEAEVKAVADYMAKSLKPLGYEYVVIDIAWYAPEASAIDERYKEPKPEQLIDAYGRLIPAPNRFPSAKEGSFKPLADHLHAQGLKLGIHVMRGIPWQAVEQNTPIKGTPYHARDIVTYEKACTFYDGMYSVDISQPGAQAYYQSLADLYAEWGIDFIKADDMTSYPPKFDEITALRYAIEQVDRPILLSLSPGSVNSWDRHFLAHYADMYRISGDFWDEWPDLKAQFGKAHTFRHHTGPGHWADLDMIPLGTINVRGEHGDGARMSRFTPDEARTLMSLWTIFRSPMMLGMDLAQMDPFTQSLLTNATAIEIDQTSIDNREVRFQPNEEAVWTATSPDGKTRYLALFNLSDAPRRLSVSWEELDSAPLTAATDVWSGEQETLSDETLAYVVPPHGVKYLVLK